MMFVGNCTLIPTQPATPAVLGRNDAPQDERLGRTSQVRPVLQDGFRVAEVYDLDQRFAG
jgi:hypothetical protein